MGTNLDLVPDKQVQYPDTLSCCPKESLFLNCLRFQVMFSSLVLSTANWEWFALYLYELSWLSKHFSIPLTNSTGMPEIKSVFISLSLSFALLLSLRKLSGSCSGNLSLESAGAFALSSISFMRMSRYVGLFLPQHENVTFFPHSSHGIPA